MRTLFCLVLVNFLVKIVCTSTDNNILTETSEIHLTGKKSCTGPGSSPFRNLVFNGRCNCKRNVKGTFCSECKTNSFGLSFKHQHGCLRCFCSGRGTTCTSSDWVRSKMEVSFGNITDKPLKVELVYTNLSAVSLPHSIGDDEELYVDNLPVDSKETYYWKLPQSLMGDRLTAYGGYLNFTINYEVHKQRQHRWLKDPLAVMSGNGIMVYYRFRKRNRRIGSHFLPIVEHVWHTARRKSVAPFGPSKSDGGEAGIKKERKKNRRVRRKELMNILADVEYILVKANYRIGAKKVSLYLLSMSDASPTAADSAEQAKEIEKCDCPEGYGGLSCQMCSSGFTRNPNRIEKEHTTTSEPIINHQKRRGVVQTSQCLPCLCNGHSNTCDEDTGKCSDCKHNTVGDYCQHSLLQCDSRGTHKHIMLPSIPSQCQCKVGAIGELCDTCKRGYFNLADENDIGCRRCWCSGVTFNCSSSNLMRFQIRIQPPAFINMGFFDGTKRRLWARNVNNGKATFYFKEYENLSDFYWSLPKKFTGNLLKSYGGTLNFSIYNSGSCEKMFHMDAFVELESFSRDVVTWKFKINPISNSVVRFSVRLSEEHFLYYGENVDRGFFLRILSSLQSLKIYVPNCRGLESTEIRNVIMDTGVNWVSKLPLTSEVEECSCPKEYSGLSCENCSLGYVKDLAGKRCIKKSTDHLNGA